MNHESDDEPIESLIEVDDQLKATLPMGSPGPYLGHVEPGGIIVLRPVGVSPEIEAAIRANPEIMRQLAAAEKAGPANARRDRPRRRRDLDAQLDATDERIEAARRAVDQVGLRVAELEARRTHRD